MDAYGRQTCNAGLFFEAVPALEDQNQGNMEICVDPDRGFC